MPRTAIGLFPPLANAQDFVHRVRMRMRFAAFCISVGAVLLAMGAQAQTLPGMSISGDVAHRTRGDVDDDAAPDVDPSRTAHVLLRAPGLAGVIRLHGWRDRGACSAPCSLDLRPGPYAVSITGLTSTFSVDVPHGRSFVVVRPTSSGMVAGGATLLALAGVSTLIPFAAMFAAPWLLYLGVITWPIAVSLLIPGIVLLAMSGPRAGVYDSDPDPPAPYALFGATARSRNTVTAPDTAMPWVPAFGLHF